jgi:hypothetical protein
VRNSIGEEGGFCLEGLAQLNRELDLAIGDGAGKMPATFLMAHGLGPFGLGMKGLKLTAEEAKAKTAFKNENREIGAGKLEMGNEDSSPKGGRRKRRALQAPVQGRFRVCSVVSIS